MKNIFLAMLAVCSLVQAAPAGAAVGDSDVSFLGKFGGWEAYAYADKGGKVCFMSANPDQQQSSNPSAKRSDAHLYITHWSVDDKKNIVSVTPGYMPDGDVKIDIDGKTSTMLSDAETAWTGSEAEDDAMTAALQKGNKAVVRAQSKRGTKTADTYSLKGSADAYRAISEACGI